MQASLEGLQSQHNQALLQHKAELQSLRESLTKQLEQMWMQRIKSAYYTSGGFVMLLPLLNFVTS